LTQEKSTQYDPSAINFYLGATRAPRTRGRLRDGEPYTVKIQGIVADLVAVILQQQRRIEALERAGCRSAPGVVHLVPAMQPMQFDMAAAAGEITCPEPSDVPGCGSEWVRLEPARDCP
jgi:hypothetical protein